MSVRCILNACRASERNYNIRNLANGLCFLTPYIISEKKFFWKVVRNDLDSIPEPRGILYAKLSVGKKKVVSTGTEEVILDVQ